MSASLAYEPVRPEKYKTLPFELKHTLSKKYSLSDGEQILTVNDLPYLEGIRDGGGEGVAKEVSKLISTIEKFGKVRLWLAY